MDNWYDYLYAIRDYFYEVFYQFRVFLFGLFDDDLDSRSMKLLLFVTIPIVFALIEVLFDWIIPTLFDLRPMGVSRFFIPKVSTFKVAELKSYNTVKPANFVKLRFYNPKMARYKLDYKPDELKRFRIMYQQKFNCTPKPMELRRFIISEAKEYGYIDPHTYLTNAKIRGAVMGAAALGKGVAKNYKTFKKWQEKKNNKEETAAEAKANLENS